MPLNARILVTTSLLAALAMAMAGCAGPSPVETAVEDRTTSIAAADTCAALTDPLSIERNSTAEFTSGQIDAAAYTAALAGAGDALEAVPVEPETDLSDALRNLISFEKMPAADGDTPISSDDYGNLLTATAAACEAGGSELWIRSNTGG